MFVAVKIERKSYEKWFHIYLISVRSKVCFRIQDTDKDDTRNRGGRIKILIENKKMNTTRLRADHNSFSHRMSWV